MGVPEISCSELKKEFEHVLIIDVREVSEVLAYHVQGSLHIPLSHFVIPKDLDRQRPIVTLCAHGVRSQTAGHLLLEAGFQSVRSLRGGLAAWRAEL